MSLWLCFHVWRLHHLSSWLYSRLELDVDEWGTPGVLTCQTHGPGAPFTGGSLARLGATKGNRCGAWGRPGRAGERLNPSHHPSCLCLLRSWPGAPKSCPGREQRAPPLWWLLSTQVSQKWAVQLASLCFRPQKVPESVPFALSFSLIVLFLILCPC